jgi:hypothetical protein
MKDRLQAEANKFCGEFGLAPVRIQFTEAFSHADIKLYNFLLSPRGGLKNLPSANRLLAQLEMLPKESAEAKAAAKKDFLWKELLENPHITGAVGIIEERDVRILKTALEICKKGIKPKILNEELEAAKAVANRIQEFHAKGKAIKEIGQLINLAYKEKGKLPLFETAHSDFDVFFHEAIHYVLYENGIRTGYNPFDEGVCTFLHTKLRRQAYWSMYFFGGRRDYLAWAKFFGENFAKIPNHEIGSLLKRNLRIYLQEFRKRF